MHFYHFVKNLNVAHLFLYHVLCMSLGLYKHGQRL